MSSSASPVPQRAPAANACLTAKGTTPKRRLIIDTDPGVDDVLALLLALAAAPEELEVVMISVTYGNVPLKSCLRNVMTLFNVLDQEIQWRQNNTLPIGFESLRAYPPIVAVGADHPLTEELLAADNFHGEDGLHGVHTEHAHLTPTATWEALLSETPPNSAWSKLFRPTNKPAHEQILDLLRDNPEDTITIATIGPMTNVALAAAEDPAAFARAKELVVMGGAIDVEGNITPVGEFNTYADAVAAARVYALTSRQPNSTVPALPDPFGALFKQVGAKAVPGNASVVLSHEYSAEKIAAMGARRLNLTLAPLDITTPHFLTRESFNSRVAPLLNAGSPLAKWTSYFIGKTFDHIDVLLGPEHIAPHGAELSLHDPLVVWYLLTADDGWEIARARDIRIEATGQWTRGMHVVDDRLRAKPQGEVVAVPSGQVAAQAPVNEADTVEVPGDVAGWLSSVRGNRIKCLAKSPGVDKCAEDMLTRVFGPAR